MSFALSRRPSLPSSLARWLLVAASAGGSVALVAGCAPEDAPRPTPTSTAEPPPAARAPAEPPGAILRAPHGSSPPLEPGWNVSVVDADGFAAGTTSIALDPHGSPVIAYLDATHDDLKVARLRDGAWTTETADGHGVGWHASLAVDVDGELHIAHYGFSMGRLLYTHGTDRTYATEVIDEEVIGRKPSLELDADGRPHVAYHDTEHDELRYAVRGDDGWTIEIVDSAGRVGDHPSLVLDPSGVAHVAYYREMTQDESSVGDLLYARRDDDGAWTLEEVDVEGMVGWYTAIALRGDGRPVVSYRDESRRALKSASRDDGKWSTVVVDEQGDLGDFNTAIAVGPDGRAVISYHDAQAGVLKVARESGDGFAVEIVDPVSFSGHYSSVTLDAAGNPHVSYSYRNEVSYSEPVDDIWLKYARFVQ